MKVLFVDKAIITSLRADRLLLMNLASSSWIGLSLDLLHLSEPAKSIKFTLLINF